MRSVYHLALRQTEGFLESLSVRLGLNLRIPDHTTLSRRAKCLNVDVFHQPSGQPLHILVDSTGLKVYVDSEWRKHSNRRLWRKIHLVVDAQTGNILASELTTNKVGDASQVPILLAQIDESIGSVAADGAYDTQLVYDTLENRQASEPVTILIPPRRRARRSGSGAISSACRDRHIQFIEGHGRRRWQKESGFNGRNLVETAMYRYKAIIGGRLRARSLASQRTETKVACSILNRMTELGMPDSYRAA